MSKYVSPFNGVKRIKVEDPKFVNAYALPKGKNRGGLLGAGGYLAGNVVTGAGQMVEGIVDVGMAGADLLRGDTDMAQYRFLKNVTKEWDEELERSYNPGTVMQIGGDVASGIGTSLMYMIPKAGIFLGAAGTFGSNVSEAAERTGEVGLKELGYAAAATVPEILLEKTIGAGVRGGKALFSAGSKALTKGTAKAGVKTVGKTATKVSKSLLGHVALETAKGMAGEGAEEAITEAIDPFLLRLFKIDENAQLDMGNVLYAGLIGSLSGGLMTSGLAAINYKSSQAAGRMIREAGLTDAFLEETRELLGGADRAKTKAEAAKGEKVTAADGSGVIGKVTAMGKNTVNTVRQSKIASSAKRIAETTRKNLQSFEQFNAKENKTAQEQAIADAMLGELRGNVYLLETSYLSETYEQAILDATPEQKQDIVDFINKSMAAKNAAKSDYTVADLDADTDGILTSMAAKYVEGDLEKYMGIRRVDTMEGRGQKATETAEEAATSPWSGLADGEDVSAFGATGEAEEALMAAAVRESVPKGSVPEMLAQFRKGTAMSPEEFASAWSDGAHIFGRYGLEVDKESPLSRMEPEAREAAMKFGRETEQAERKTREEKAKAKKKPAAQEGKKGTVVRGEGLNVQKLSDEQYVAYKGAELLAEVLGTEIVIETKILTTKGKEANGYYDTKTNRLHVNINAMRDGKNISLYTLGHEVTHYIKEWSPQKFEALADFVLDQMGVDAEEAIADKLASLKRLGIVTDTMTIAEANAKAREELVAEGMELVLTDGKVLEELAHTDRSIWQKVKAWIQNIISKIRKYYGELNQASKTAQVLKETVESLEEIERLFTEGVTEAGERTRTAGVENTLEDNGSPTRKYLISEEIPSTLSAEDQNLLFDADFYERYENESREPITETVEELEAAKASEAFATMSDDEAFDLNAKLKAKRAGYNTVYDYYVETEKERMAEEYRRYVQTGRSNRTSRTLEEKRKKAQKERTLRSDVDSATPLQNAQYQIIQETNPMWDEYHTGIRSPKEIKTFAEVAEDPDSFTWGDFTREDARKALRDGTVRVYSSYAIKNGVFVSTSYKQALGYAGNDPAHVHSRVVALDSVAWINGDEGQYAKVYKDDGIRYSIDETPETPDVSENRDLTDREILGMALEGAVQSQEEYNIVKSYREQASMLELVKEKRNGYSKEAAALERQIKALRSRMEEEGDPNGFIRKALDEAIAKKRNAEAMRDEQDRILDNSTKELLKLKAAKPFRELVDREGRRAKAAERKAAKAVESADAKVERTKQRADRRIEKAKAEYESREKYKDDRREVTTRKRAAQRILGSLNTALYNPTKAKHVPLQLHDLVETTLKSADPKQFGINRDHIREMSGLAAEIEKLERKAALTGEEQETLNKMKGRYEHLEADTISVKRQAEALNTAFKKYQKQVTEADMMDKDLMDALDGYVSEIEEAPLTEMNLKSLIAVERFYTALLHQVNNSNKTFATEKAVAIDKLGTDANTEVKEVKALKFLQPRAMELAGLAGVRGFFWNNMKPLTVFDAIGSETFAKLFKNVMDGEDVWATDLEEAHEFLQETKKEYGYDKWDLKKRSEITTADGTKVALTLGEKMSLYAYMFREQAEEHLSIGGFTFAPNAKTVAAYKDGKIKYEAVLNDQKQYHMRKEDIVKMAESLTEEQRAYAEAVQKYLTRLGKKGNEVSVKLYGLELFNETAYFPIKSNRDYLAASTGKSGDPNIKSRGTFKETVPDASNPIVLEDFMEVTTNHINTMATYHAFVLPIEDLTRVWNYTPVNIKRDENGEAILDENGMPVADTDGAAGYNSLKAEITKKYGAEANDYILQLIRDLNGGARRDAAATILDKGLTAFKRAATTMSASTIIQQPTSVIRAMAYVDAKHFSGASITPWETVKKYAKVAFIKEMGGFDTGTGARTQEFLNQREYDNIGQKVKAAVTPEVYGGDPQARAEFFGWLTSKADEKTWCFLFGAVVNEQAERLGKPKDSEEVLKAAGERFTEVVRRTQVYDSTLTRNQYMRSKDGLMKMATSFMAEPSTVVSMAADAIIRLERGDKMFIRKTAAGIAGSIILNAMAVSLIYAMRDDDEEKNYLEKYISSLTGEIVEGLNPLEYFPILRDIMSLFKGYEVERSDMTLINNLLEQVEMITSSKRSFMDKMIGVTGAVAAFFGIPVTNLYRDVKGLTTTTISLFNGEPMTAKGTASAALEGVTDQFGLFKKLFGGDRGTSYELYRAKVSGDKSHYDRVAARYDSPEAEEQALRRELRENDKRIGEAAEARRSGDIEVYKSLVEQITDEGIFDRGMVIRAIQTEMNALSRETEKGTVVPKDTEVADEETVEVVSLYSSSDLNAALERGDTEDFKEIYESMVSDRVQAGKTEAQAKSAVKSSITAYWKPRYIEARNANDTETMKKILQILLSSGLYGSRNDVAVMLEGWIKAYAKSK